MYKHWQQIQNEENYPNDQGQRNTNIQQTQIDADEQFGDQGVGRNDPQARHTYDQDLAIRQQNLFLHDHGMMTQFIHHFTQLMTQSISTQQLEQDIKQQGKEFLDTLELKISYCLQDTCIKFFQFSKKLVHTLFSKSYISKMIFYNCCKQQRVSRSYPFTKSLHKNSAYFIENAILRNQYSDARIAKSLTLKNKNLAYKSFFYQKNRIVIAFSNFILIQNLSVCIIIKSCFILMILNSDQPKMVKKVFVIETVILITHVLSILTKNIENQRWIIMLEVLMFLTMIAFEGAKPYYPLYFLTLIAQFMNVKVLQIVILVALGAYKLKYSFYKITIFNKGRFQVGFRHFQKQEKEFAVFYPTKQKGKAPAWIQTDKYSKDLYDLTFMDPLKTRWIPYRLFKFFITYMNHYKIPAQLNVSLCRVNPQETQFPVILFSHGLSSNMTSHSSYCCWLASQGFIVISLQHNHDLVRLAYDQQLLKRKDMLKKIMFQSRNHDLQMRSQEVETYYNLLVEGKLMKDIFPQEEICVKSVHLAGHSFGGATCLEGLANLTAKKIDISLIKGAICIDPWLFPLSESTLRASLRVEITVINSQTFIERMPAEFQMRQKLFRISQNNPDNFKVFVLMGSDHVFSTDFIFVCGNGVSKITKCLNYSQSQTYFSLLQLITQLAITKNKEKQILDQVGRFLSQINTNANIQVKKQWRHQQSIKLQ